MSALPSRPVATLSEAGLMAAAFLGAAALGAVTALAAFRIDPLAVPALLVAGALVAVSLSRPEIGVGAGFLLLPLGPLGLAGPSAWLASSAWAAWMFVLALVAARGRTEDARFPPLAGWVLLFVGTVVVALPSTDPGVVAPILRAYVTGAMLFYAAATFATTRRAMLWALGGVAAGALIVGGMAVWQVITGSATQESFITGAGQLVARADAGFGQPNQLGGFLVVLVPFVAAYTLIAPRLRGLALLALVLTVAGVYLSFSRSALIAMLVIPLFFVRFKVMLVALPMIAVLVIAVAPDLGRERFATLTEGTGEVATRMDFWRNGVAIWREHPLFGVGPGMFPDAYAETRVVSKEYLPDSLFVPPPHAHNLVINVLAEQGLLGTVPLLALFFAAARVAVRLRRAIERSARLVGTALLASIAAFAIHNQFDVTLLEATGSFMLGLLGLGAAALTMEQHHE